MDYTSKHGNRSALLGGGIAVVDVITGQTVYIASGIALSGRAKYLGLAYGIYRATVIVVAMLPGM
ncbi:MAG: hypothetical protein IPP93_12310 [Chitinophagaceae bacterium]|nr:hypothetical protein [Chitinophagaceae bacterium]